MERVPMVVGNWKMKLSYREEIALAKAVAKKMGDSNRNVDVVVCPGYASLHEIFSGKLLGKHIALGAQNIHWEVAAAATGQTSVEQIKNLVRYCIVGHSEQRALTGETDDLIAQKIRLLLDAKIFPVVCIGENREQRDAGEAVARVQQQMQSVLGVVKGLEWPKVTLVYEPIWAISSNNVTGETPDPREVSETSFLMRKMISHAHGQEIAERVRVLYGGSVTGENAASFVAEPGVDGALPGSASLKVGEFLKIVEAVEAH